MIISGRFYFTLFASVLLLIVPAAAEKRVALVIGNGAYVNAPRLPNPKNDASDVSSALKRLGFDTIDGQDLDKQGMQNAAIRFSRAAKDADVALFYYSGHAMQFAGVNYLMPVDAKLTDEADLRLMTRVDEVVSDLQRAKALRILVLDSCRDNPLAEELKRSIGTTRAAGLSRGLAKIDSPQGMVVAYSTQAGRTAEDGAGRNSPYTTSFLRNIETSEEIGTIFRRTISEVYENTKRTQLPELSLSLIGEYYLKDRPSTPQTGPDPKIAILEQQLKAAQDELKARAASEVSATAKAKAAADEQSRLAAVGAGIAQQQKAAADAKAAEQARLATEAAKKIEQDRVVEAERAKNAAVAKANEPWHVATKAPYFYGTSDNAPQSDLTQQIMADVKDEKAKLGSQKSAEVYYDSTEVTKKILGEMQRLGCYPKGKLNRDTTPAWAAAIAINTFNDNSPAAKLPQEISPRMLQRLRDIQGAICVDRTAAGRSNTTRR